MLAFDFPPNDVVAVEYVGLAQASAQAETQKDVLRRALSELLPNAGEIVEFGDGQPRRANSQLFVRCLQCDFRNEMTHFNVRIEEEERYKRVSNLDRSQFKIFIQRVDQNDKPAQQNYVWTVEIGTRKTAWFLSLKTDLLPADGRISAKNFAVQSCIEGVNCPKTQLYGSQTECEQRVRQWSNRRIDLSALSYSAQKSGFISSEKIPFLSDVKASSSVRATMKSSNSTLSIRANAKALRSGSLGDVIPVEMQAVSGSSTKGKFVEARITGEGEVEVVR